MKGESLETALSAARLLCPSPKPEQEYLLVGLLLAWAEFRLPLLREEFEFTLIEQELRWKMGEFEGVEVVDLLRLDALLKRRSDGALFYGEFKSSASCDEGWVKSWEINSQALINISAVEEILGVRIHGILIEGLEKGYRGEDRSKRRLGEIQHSPLCYGWRFGSRLESEYFPGALKVSWWEEGKSPQEVAEILGERRKSLLIPLPPIRPRPTLLARHRRQALMQELRVFRGMEEIEGNPEAREILLDLHFPQNPDHCRRFKRSPCPFLDICYDEQVGMDPLGSGLYEPRIPNHPEGERQ